MPPTSSLKPTSTSRPAGPGVFPGLKDKENKGETKKAQAVIHWAKPENFHLTDSLLTLIEDSVTWKVALGFDKGPFPNPTPTGKGKTLIQHCSDIAEVFFLGGDVFSDGGYTKDDLPMLKGVIKNRVHSLKSAYTEHRKTLGETGHGLITTGCVGELQEGSNIANAWELIEEKFPWYLHLNELMGGSPVSSRKAIANSQSNLDLAVLGIENEVEIL
ncbi:hypothetical protein JVU11DRAFT_6672 [Chiua virens]|nr:hypothetical protein JVU11DRAFT_6672 [Chiua virens]